jgi:signal transduction histidine kinase/CheY-like chemotaxis protein
MLDMTSFQPTPAALAEQSREFALVIDDNGNIGWADDRSGRFFGVGAAQELAGRPFTSLIAPGSEDKVARMMNEARAAASPTRWELLLHTGDGPTIATLTAVHFGNAVLVTGSQSNPEHDALLTQMSDALSEIAALHRESERQQREIDQGRAEVSRLNRDLADTGQGMAALYGELSDQNDSMKAMGESRSRFVASMSHELRTPLSSILGLTRLLLARTDGDLNAEQQKQVVLIERSAQELLTLVNDLLDISKLDAGQLKLRPTHFDVQSLFSTLRGQLRPIAAESTARLIFETPEGLPALDTDEGKIAQIVRNFVTNALKFTPDGEVRVIARDNGDGTVSFLVRDTGIGIAPMDLERVFEEFVQIDNPLQRKVRGTGLGLSVSRRMAEMLGGVVTAESEVGRGSTFTLTVPAVHADVEHLAGLEAAAQNIRPGLAPVLVVEDDPQAFFLYERYLLDSGFQVIPARSIEQARALLTKLRPAAIVLDVMLHGETSWRFLEDVKQNPATSDVPVLVVTVMDRERKARALGADEFYVKPVDRDWLRRKLVALSAKRPVRRILVIDDDPVARYVIQKYLADDRYEVLEAPDASEGLARAKNDAPDVIFLDFVLGQETAFEVLDELKVDPRTRSIPVIIATSKQLDEAERERLQAGTVAILTKDQLSREVAITRIRDALTKHRLTAHTGMGEGSGSNGHGPRSNN